MPILLIVCIGIAQATSFFRENGSPSSVSVRLRPSLSGPVQDTVTVTVIAQGLSDPLYLTAPAGDPRLFIVEQEGRVRIEKDGRLLAKPFLDLMSRVGSGGERGLLSIAFHPRYRDNGFFIVNFTDKNGDTHIERLRVSADPDVADAASAKLLLLIEQPYANHNGGHILFGPDGMLYVGMGDGGAGGDPHGNGQKLGTLLGKLLRIDVDHGDPYTVPPDNPFVATTAARGEIWAYGLRNPWRLAFDRAAGLLYIADVGQNQWEEVDVQPAGQGGQNYGWNTMEGAHCYVLPLCRTSGLTLPAVEYGHDEGCSVIGGYVYRGTKWPALTGQYFYSDYCRGWLKSFRFERGVATSPRTWNVGDLGSVLSFGEDAAGELYILSANGRVYQIKGR